MKAPFTYEVIREGVDFDGWYKWTLRRSDGRETKVGKTRLRKLRAEGRLKE